MTDDRKEPPHGRRDDERSSGKGRGRASDARRGQRDAKNTAGRAARSVRTERDGGGGRRSRPEASRTASRYEPVHLADDVVRELTAAARPGKGDLLVKVFADAVAAYAAGDHEEAVRLGDQAKQMALRSPAVREFVGLTYYDAGRWKEAITELAAFRRISGSTDQNPVLADCYRAVGKPDKAVQVCDEVGLRAAPAIYFEAQIVAAGALADQRRLDDAIGRLEALELDPAVAEEHHIRAWYALADLLERRGRYTQATTWFSAVAATDPELTDAPDRLQRLSSRG